jgi:hypothetical protein
MKSIRVYRFVLSILSLTLLMLPKAHGQGGAGYALSFDAANHQYVSIPSIGSLSGIFTVEMWVKFDAAPTSPVNGFLGSRSPGDTGFDVKYTGGPTSGLHGDIGDGSKWVTTAADASTTFQANTWYHIAYVVTPTNYAIYLNGLQLTNASYVSSVPVLFDANHILNIGRAHPTEYLTGVMDEVRVWNLARSGAEILANKNHSLRGDEAGLVQYYRFDEGSGSTVSDSAAVGGFSTGNLINTPLFVPSDLTPFTAFAPEAETLGVVSISGSSIRLGGAANPAGTNMTAWFAWGTTTNYGNVTSAQDVGGGTNEVNFSEILSNLDASTTYHFRAVASNAVGVVVGEDLTFPIVRPQLALTLQNTNGVLSWRKTAPAFLLEQSGDLSSGDWTTLYGATVSNGCYQMAMPMTNAMFYRLRQLVNGPITPIIFVNRATDDEGLEPICPDDPSGAGCVRAKPLAGSASNMFDALLTVDPNRRPEDPASSCHWQIFFPDDQGGAKYTAAGITGYLAPVLTIRPNSIPNLGVPNTNINGQWRMILTITHHSTDPFSSGTETTEVRFRFKYADTALTLEQSSICQNPAADPAECTIDAARRTTEPN